MDDTDNRIGHGSPVTDPIQRVLYKGFDPVNEPATSGEMAAKACLDDLCKTWNVMLDAGMTLPTSRIFFDVDAVIEVLTQFKRHQSKKQPTPFKVLKGK